MKFSDLILPLVETVLEAGKAIVEIYDKGDWQVIKKKDLSPVTIADRASHKIISKKLREFSSLPLLSEEGSIVSYRTRKKWKQLWMVDPLDGTKEFINRNGEFTVNIALISEGFPLAGIVYSPVQGKIYIGDRNNGSWLIDTGKNESAMSPRHLLKNAEKLPLSVLNHEFTVVSSRSHLTPNTNEYIELLKKKHTRIRFITVGSSLKLCLVAEGSADCYPRLGQTMEWDTAAADAVVRYAGGSVVRYDNGMPLVYNKEQLVNPFFIARRL